MATWKRVAIFLDCSQSNNLTEPSYPAGQNPGGGFIVDLSSPKIFANILGFSPLISTLQTQGFNKILLGQVISLFQK